MKKVVLPLLTICFGLISSIVPPASAIDSSRGFAFTDKVILAYYYIWFNENNWIKTAAEGGRKEGLEGLHPLVGAYNSWDPAIIEKHMLQMNRALIDALAVSCGTILKRMGRIISSTSFLKKPSPTILKSPSITNTARRLWRP